MSRKHLFGSASMQNDLIGAGIGMAAGGLVPVAIRRIKWFSDKAAAEPDGVIAKYVLPHASAVGAVLVAAAAGVAFALKKKDLATTIAIIGGAVAIPRLVSDYSTADAGGRMGVVTAEELRGGPVRFLGNGLGVYTAQELRGNDYVSGRGGTVRVLGGAYGANPITTAHRS